MGCGWDVGAGEVGLCIVDDRTGRTERSPGAGDLERERLRKKGKEEKEGGSGGARAGWGCWCCG